MTEESHDIETASSKQAFTHLSNAAAAILSRQVHSTTTVVRYKSLFRYATNYDICFLAVSGFSAIAAGASLPLMTIIYGSLAGTFQGFFLGTVSGSQFMHEVNRLTLYFVYLAIGQFATIYIATVGFNYVGEHIAAKVRVNYLAGLLRQNIAYFDLLGAGEITTRITADTNLFQDGISGKLALTLQGFATFITTYIISYIRYWKLALILTSTIVAIVLTGGVLGRLSIGWSSLSLASYAKGGSIVEETISSIRNTIAAGTQDRLVKAYDKHLADAETPAFRAKATTTATVGFMMCYIYLSYALAFWLGSKYVASGDCSLSDVLTILLAIIMGAFALGGVAPNMQAFATAIAAASKIFSTIDRPSPLDPNDKKGHRIDRSELKGLVEFRQIKLIYPSRPHVVTLDSVSFNARPNETTALVGVSGSGKSSIVGLLERFYEPLEGDILLDGVKIEELSLQWLRQQVSIVSQEPVLFATTIAHNIRHGLIGTKYEHLPDDDEQVLALITEAAKTAHAHDFICDLSQGYQTNVGIRGLLLSGGQKQRIAIARAIIGDPKILLLDEATSALDTKSEGIVQAALDRASHGRTTIVIAHRLSTIKHAHNIIVMSHGKIVEQGTHNALLEAKGVYHTLVEAQGIVDHNISTCSDLFPVTDPSNPNEKVRLSGNTEEEKRATQTEAASLTSTTGPEAQQYPLWRLITTVASFNIPDWPYGLAGILCAFATGGAIPAQSVLFAKSIASLALPQDDNAKSQVAFWSWMFFLLAIAQLFAYLVQAYVVAWCSEKLVRRARNACFRAILRQDTAFFDRAENSAGALTSFLSTTANNLAGISGSTLSTILSAIVTLFSGFIIALAIGWKLALVCISTVPVVLGCGFCRVWVLARFQALSKQSYEGSASYACESTSAIRTVASLTREDDVLCNYRQQLHEQGIRSLKSILQSSALYAASQSLGFAVNALAFWYGGQLIAQHEYSIFQFFVCFSATVFGAQSAGIIFSFAPDLGKGKQAATDMKTLLDRQPIIDSSSMEGQYLKSTKGDIEFRDVYFEYPVRSQLALRGLNIHIKSGQYAALVGASGSGKSTAISLLERFYDPTRGAVYLDGINVSTLNVATYRRHFALVAQEPTLYQGTIRDNIMMGTKDEETISDEAFMQACKDANILDFIQSLPDGFNTDVGVKGSMLSGGQKQRVCIARALIRNPRILLLDESSSALDSESEQVVQAALDVAAQGRTTIAVAHRLSSIQRADIIFVLDSGRVIERGTHRELIARQGRYSELVHLQNLLQT
ncbi:Leptomycin B resistance protein pmd1-like protein 2 [Paraphaeosphaeria sporulosa]